MLLADTRSRLVAERRFYTGMSLLTVLVQAALSRVVLERFGLARSVATLPAAVGIGNAGTTAESGAGGDASEFGGAAGQAGASGAGG